MVFPCIEWRNRALNGDAVCGIRPFLRFLSSSRFSNAIACLRLKNQGGAERTDATPGGNADRCEKKGVAGKAIRNVVKTKGEKSR
jgi:hypothetical protein